MKYILLLLALLSIKVNAQWSDNFSDGNFNVTPLWTGDSSKYIVNQSGQLQLNAPAVNGSAYISTPSLVGYKASWTFLVKMDFNPSSSNYVKIFLMSDLPDLTSSLNGYYIRVGGTNDDLCLIRKEGGTESLIADGIDNIFNSTIVNAKIKVTHDESGNWDLYCDTTGNENYKITAHCFDNNILKSNYFGLQCIYSATRSTKIYFDDFVVTGEEYKEPPPVLDSSQLYDIVFNEIMADPTPVAGLPECEFLELYNRSGKQLNLKGWKLFVGSYFYTFPETQLLADSYLIISSKGDESKFASFGNVLGLFSSSLNNTGQYLKLENRDGKLIAWVDYDDTWYGDNFKAQGGWSLEQIDPWNPCGGKVNWNASNARLGGTPGSKNSVIFENPDITIPDIVNVNIPKDTILELYFNEPVDSVLATNSNTYTVNPEIGKPKKIIMLSRDFSAVQLVLPISLLPGKTYTLLVNKEITDCAGNPLSQALSIPVGLPVLPDSTDIAINEVLFNARVGGVDYVELYNRSNKILNTSNLLIGTKVDGKIGNLCRLSETGSLIQPKTYIVLSQDCEKIKPFYHVNDGKCFVNLACMPSLDDKASTLVLVNDSFGKIDEFSYSETMHLSTLKNLEGISLERVNPNMPAYFPGNWHSTAEIAGYGTPGYKNSQYLADTVNSSSITLTDEIFSPDNDGYKDILQISYKFDEADCRAQVYIFDAMGRLVRRLLNNELLGTNGSFTWDGTSDAGKLCNVGMYIIFIRTVFDNGTVKEYKKSCVLAMRR